MRKISNCVLTILLFILGTYGERIFNYAYTLMLYIPQDIFITFEVIVSGIALILLSNRQ